MDKYFIIGLGWLGSPLARHFVDAGDIVAGTTRGQGKSVVHEQIGVTAYLYDLYHSDINVLPESAITNANVIINIPPGRRDFSPTLFVQKMRILFDYIIQYHAKHICFISTTSVFGGHAGRITNSSLFHPNTASGKVHAELELYLKSIALESSKNKDMQPRLQISVLRLAGLVGADRHPITSLSGKSDISLGKNPVNLIHQEDVIRVICALLSSTENIDLNSNRGVDENLLKEQTAPYFFAGNLCSTEHPSRERYYTWCAKQLGIRWPVFNDDTRILADGKFIDATETLNKLNIELTYSSPYQMLKSLPPQVHK
ncbi:MAG: nucleoside-diphosphate-sugar epimerase [Candidatus Azotimanducaceae bacterium]|jgi:nucleoside-diphosphate-sugar epimerase